MLEAETTLTHHENEREDCHSHVAATNEKVQLEHYGYSERIKMILPRT